MSNRAGPRRQAAGPPMRWNIKLAPTEAATQPLTASQRRRQARSIERPLEPEDVPQGSVMADATLADIAAGRYLVQERVVPIPTQGHVTKATLRARRRRERLARKLHRRRR